MHSKSLSGELRNHFSRTSAQETPARCATSKVRTAASKVERLEVFDPTARLYRYTIEETVMSVDNHRAQFHVEADEDGASTVIWPGSTCHPGVRMTPSK